MRIQKKLLLILSPIFLLGLIAIGLLISKKDILIDTRPKIKYAKSFGVVGTGGYECSKDIKLVLQKVTYQTGDTGVEYQPENFDEVKLYCQMTYAEEYKGKLTVLERPEVVAVLSRHAYKDSWIKALDFKYIEDKEFVRRLLPAYANKKIGCIIVLFTPEGNKVYLENEELDTFEQMSDKDFVTAISTASTQDQIIFWSNLR